MDINITLSGLAIVVSVISFIISFWHNRRTALAAVRPVLVFVFDKRGWILRNIGNGPALNLTVARSRDGKQWIDPLRVPPLPKDAEFCLPPSWLKNMNIQALGVNYTDFDSHPYFSQCKDDLSMTVEKHMLPIWKENEIARHWTV